VVRILGLDPSLQNTGWGLVETSGNRLSFVACGSISPSGKGLVQKLADLHNGLSEVLEKHKPEEVAVEETFVNKNAMSSLKLGHARGALMLTICLAGIIPEEYAATLVKKSIVGAGRAEKEQVMVMVKHLLPGADIKNYDEADALAVAICHFHHAALEKAVRKAEAINA